VIFRIDPNAPPQPRTEKEVRACGAELVDHVKGAQEAGIASKDLATHIRTQLGPFDYKIDKPVNPQGHEWKYEVGADGHAREGPINE